MRSRFLNPNSQQKLFTISLTIISLFALSSPLPIQAITLEIDETAEEIFLENQTTADTATQPATESVEYYGLSFTEVISLIFGSLAGICLFVMIAATYIWITANGEDEQIEKARRIWHIALFVLLGIILVWILILYLIFLLRNLGS